MVAWYNNNDSDTAHNPMCGGVGRNPSDSRTKTSDEAALIRYLCRPGVQSHPQLDHEDLL